ncbi:hypothetical protein FQN60_016065 [Etheostoma spectabile]|uniref:Uncharacterized protein n=1 Tax=Etheostoma spectabile TaxID=54343 RepID=A0A5J5C753_9PERO|nr:hypothetical protein FQN60_016065 [Etheostoma spectabile]
MFACLSVVRCWSPSSACASAPPDLRDEETRGECSQKCQSCSWWSPSAWRGSRWSSLLRFVNAQSKMAFAAAPSTSSTPSPSCPSTCPWVFDVRDESQEDAHVVGAGRGYLDKLSLILRLLRALRILYVMRLARHPWAADAGPDHAAQHTGVRPAAALRLRRRDPLLAPGPPGGERAGAVRRHAPPQSFSSIPASYWWAIIS